METVMVDLLNRVPGSWLGWAFIAAVLLGLINSYELPHKPNPFDACVASHHITVQGCVDIYWRHIDD